MTRVNKVELCFLSKFVCQTFAGSEYARCNVVLMAPDVAIVPAIHLLSHAFSFNYQESLRLPGFYTSSLHFSPVLW